MTNEPTVFLTSAKVVIISGFCKKTVSINWFFMQNTTIMSDNKAKSAKSNGKSVQSTTSESQVTTVSVKPYMRVGTTMYKRVNQPNINGGFNKRLVPWTATAIKADHGYKYYTEVPRYDGFCTVPSHTNYEAVRDNFLNLYQPIDHIPLAGDFSNIKSFLLHIFGEQYELGIDYLQLLYLRPVQKLPILMLVSEERNTGKTTFLNFLRAIFQENVTFNTNEDFRSQFNAEWAGKLLIVVDEVLLSRREDTERLKNLSTAKSFKIEAKGKDRHEVDFFAKFVLCSNNESCPVIIDPEETRYWVRKICTLKSDDTFFLDKIKAEIPAFLHHLQHRQMSTEQKTRMWFSPQDIHTDALDKIIKNNRPQLEIEIAEVFLDIMDKMNVKEVDFCLNDVMDLLMFAHVKADKLNVRRIVKDSWKLEPKENGLTYTAYVNNYSNGIGFNAQRRVGRFYTIFKDALMKVLSI